MTHKKNILNITFSILFVLMLVLPNLINFFNLESEILKNKYKTLKNKPEFDFDQPSESLKKLTDYYSSSFGGKATLLNQYTINKRLLFNESAKPSNAVIGKDEWFFLGDKYNNVFNGTFGNNALTSDQLNTISNNLKKSITYLDSKNIEFYLVVPPNKHTIYKEYLPYQRKSHPTNLDLLKAHLKKTINLEIIDFRELFLSKKNSEELYLKADSHWNEYGAYLGYEEFMKHYNKPSLKAKVITLDSFSILRIEKSDNNDVAKMINYLPKSVVIDLEYKLDSQVKVTQNSTRNYLKYVNPSKNLKIMMHRDSYAIAWIDYFNETFGECVYLRGHRLKKALIEKEKPDVLIIEIIERDLIKLSK